MKTIIFLLALFSIFTARAQQNISLYEVHTPIGFEQKDSLLRVLHKHNSPDFYVVPNIQKSKLKNAKKTCLVPMGEDIFALINMNVSGKAKNCILIGSSGIYIHNGWTSQHPGRYFISYSELRESKIAPAGFLEVNIGTTSIDISGSMIKARALMDLLLEIKSL